MRMRSSSQRLAAARSGTPMPMWPMNRVHRLRRASTRVTVRRNAMLGGGFGRVGFGMGYDFVLDSFGVFEEERIVAGWCVSGIFPWRSDDDGADCLDFVMKAVDLCSRVGPESEVAKGAGPAPMNGFLAKGGSRRGESKGEPLVAVFDYKEVVLFDNGAAAALFAESENRKQPVIKRRCNSHIAHRYLNVIDDWFHVAGNLINLAVTTPAAGSSSGGTDQALPSP